jgi:drug/metabolite transporter (DMT)-like permease
MSGPDDDGRRPATWILSAAFCFAIMGALTHALGPRCDWLTIALVRTVFMFAASVVVARAAGVELVVWRPATLWMRSLAGSLSLVCSFYALTRLPLGDVLTLTNTYPLWIVMLSWLSVRRAPGAGDALAVASGLTGVALIERPHLTGDHLAAAVALLASVFSAVAMLGLHKLRGVDPRAVVAHFAGVASLFVAGSLLARGPVGAGDPSGSTPDPGVAAVTLLMLLGVGASGTVGQVFLTRAYAAGAPARVAVLGLTQVVFGLGLDVLLWQRAMSPASVAGTLLVLAPSAWLFARAGGDPSAAAPLADAAVRATATAPDNP